eukprot:NODE_81_length_22758_cov_0.877797.p18 type:complete len:105 gc:universal NODE_81_length_22758_cov_0.877797:14933-14619(-)
MRTFSSQSAAWPFSSNAITTTAAPNFLISRAFLRKSTSPSLREMLLTMHFPCKHSNPFLITAKLLESTIIGTLEQSGSGIIKLQNFRIVVSPSIIPSSTFISII